MTNDDREVGMLRTVPRRDGVHLQRKDVVGWLDLAVFSSSDDARRALLEEIAETQDITPSEVPRADLIRDRT